MKVVLHKSPNRAEGTSIGAIGNHFSLYIPECLYKTYMNPVFMSYFICLSFGVTFPNLRESLHTPLDRYPRVSILFPVYKYKYAGPGSVPQTGWDLGGLQPRQGLGFMVRGFGFLGFYQKQVDPFP